jgi:hypothetical protein
MKNTSLAIVCLFLLYSTQVFAINFVRVSENANMIVYIDVDSIIKDSEYISANEIRDYKIPMEFDKTKTYRSSLGVAEIDCKRNTHRIAFLDTFELNGLKGKRLSHGVVEPLIAQIKPNTMTADVRDFLCTRPLPRKI